MWHPHTSRCFPATLLCPGSSSEWGLGCMWAQRTGLMMGRDAEGAGPFVWSKVTDGGCWAYLCDVFEAMQVLLQGSKALTWLQTEPTCGPLDLAALRTLEVASGHLASCVHLPGASDGPHGASCRDSLTPALRAPVWLPGPSPGGRGRWRCSGTWVCSPESPW